MLEQFAEQLLSQKGMPGNIDPEVKAQMVKDLAARAEDYLNRKLIDSLSDDQVAQFNQLLDSDPSAEAVQEFIDKNVANKQELTTSALLEFQELYLGPKA
ncbi:MAG TPA: DUF5663 domain-containing protein [Candidatus Saccharimonadales bacterium]|nr:DUF5663 domain-containing protein [Candidatus Saccharimonadales bacterium]